jgi:predicted ATPase
MRSLRLKNFRSLVDTGRIELRPLTVLVGANSSGKSSFLRFFPLLRQTYKKSAASPLLWFADPGLDFGDFSKVVRRGAEPREIEVEFEIELPPQRKGMRIVPAWSMPLPVRITTYLNEEEGKTSVRRCVVTCYDDVCNLEFRDRSGVATFQVNGRDIVAGTPPQVSSLHSREDQHLIPQVFSADVVVYAEQVESIVRELGQAIRAIANVDPGRERATGVFRGITYGSPDDVLEQLRVRDWGERWHHRILDITTSSSEFKNVKELLFAACVDSIIDVEKTMLESAADKTVYLGPFRAPPQRFYRRQELSVRHMDPEGGNLAMFLYELSSAQLGAFSEFMFQNVGFRVRLETQGSNISILLEDGRGQSDNLIDMGYGFSQVLPVIAQCWAAASGFQPSEREPLPSLIAIEQPELHLHPHYQAKLADMFVGTIQAARGAALETPTLLVETHSEALVSRLGELVEGGKIASEDVVVLLFEADAVNGGTTVRQSTFSAEGTLTNWPLGFFAP